MEIQERGILITFEGIEGSGKTTQLELLAQRLELSNKKVRRAFEPGSTGVGRAVRHFLLHVSQEKPLYPETELLLFAAARAQLVRECFVPELSTGAILLCDRFLDSSFAYQSAARGLAADPVQCINAFAVGSLMPDLTIILDVPAELGLQRARCLNDLDRIEKEDLSFHHKVREGYRKLSQGSGSERFFLVDGTEPKDAIAHVIWEAFEARFSINT